MKKSIIIFLCLVSLSVGFGGIAALHESPFFGMGVTEHAGEWFVATIDPGGPADVAGIRPGMRIVRIGGQVLTQYSLISDLDMIPDFGNLTAFWDFQFSLGKLVRPGSQLAFTVVDSQGQSLEVTISPVAFHFSEILGRVAPLYIGALYCLAIGLAVALKRSRDGRAGLFFVLLFSVSLILFTFGSWSSRDLIGNTTLMLLLAVFNLAYSFPFFPVIFLHFCLSFPERAKILEKRWFAFGLYILPIAVLAMYIPRISYEIYMLYWALGLASGVSVMIIRYFRDRNPLHRAQIKWILWGTSVFGLGMCVTYAAPLLARTYIGYSYLLPSLAFLLIPSTFAFAILRYRLLKIDALFDATFAYTLSAGIFIGIDLGAAFLLSRLLTLEIVEQYVFASIVTILLVMFFYVPVKERLLMWTRKLFKRDIYRAEEVALSLSNNLIMTDSEEKALSVFYATLSDTLHPQWIYSHERGSYSGLPRTMSSQSAALLASKLRTGTFTSSIGYDSVFNEEDCVDAFSGAAIVPLNMKDNSVSLFVVGPKISGNLYSSNDLLLLDSMSSLTALALDELREHERRQRLEEEKEADHVRISREIHDGIGGMLANAIMISDMVLSEPLEKHIQTRLGSVRSLLTQSLADLRTMIWALRDSDSDIRDFGASIQSHALNMIAGHSIRLEFSALALGNESIPLSATMRANLFRSVQELIANSIRHGEPGLIRIRLQEFEDSISIEYRDDGIGCDLRQVRSSGYGLANIQMRIHALDGRLQMQSDIGHGFEANISVPLRREQHDRSGPQDTSANSIIQR